MINHPMMEKIAEKAGTRDGDSYDFQLEVIAALEAAEAKAAQHDRYLNVLYGLANKRGDTIDRLEAENAALRAANESVAVCAKHVKDVTSGDCTICEIEALRARVAELEAQVPKMYYRRLLLNAVDRWRREAVFDPEDPYKNIDFLENCDAAIDWLESLPAAPGEEANHE